MVHEDGNLSFATMKITFQWVCTCHLLPSFRNSSFNPWLLVTLRLAISFIVAHTSLAKIIGSVWDKIFTNILPRGVQFCARFHWNRRVELPFSSKLVQKNLIFEEKQEMQWLLFVPQIILSFTSNHYAVFFGSCSWGLIEWLEFNTLW